MTSRLFSAMSGANPTPPKTRTANGDVAYASSGSPLVDLMQKLGNARGQSITGLVNAAAAVDLNATIALLLHARDIRGGMGERDTSIRALARLAINFLDVTQTKALVRAIVALGRFKDLSSFMVLVEASAIQDYIVMFWVDEVLVKKNALAAKWIPVKDRKGAKIFRKHAGLNERDWRKAVVEVRQIVETQMSEGKWDEINFSHVPSRAMNLYYAAFKKHQPARFQAYLDALTKPELKTKGVKMNSGTLYPYEIIENLCRGNAQMADAQWDALPNFFEGEKANILCVVDTSGSMTQRSNPNDRSSPSCLSVACSLALYCSERVDSIFKDSFISFSTRPTIQQVTGSISQRFRQMDCTDWDMTTNLGAVFNLVLNTAVRNNLPHEDMPSKILIVSDMQFDACVNGRGTAYERTRQKFIDAGYEPPVLVFWQMGRASTAPAKATDVGVNILSGLSPATLKQVFGNIPTPLDLVFKIAEEPKYQLASY